MRIRVVVAVGAVFVGAFSSVAELTSVDVVCAAWNTPRELVSCARYVCPSNDARPVLQKAIDEAYDLGVRCVLLKGTYVLDSRGESSPRGCLRFPNRAVKGRVYAHNASQFNVLEGATMPLGWFGSAELLMGRALYDSIRATGRTCCAATYSARRSARRLNGGRYVRTGCSSFLTRT